MLTHEQAFFAELVEKECGIVLDEDKGYLLDSRLNPVARSLGFNSLKEFYEAARKKITPEYRKEIIEALTTNESLFFRDGTPFRILREKIIPELKQKNIRPVRIWCAAASTGQEPYSIVISFLEEWPEITPSELTVIATDVDSHAIEKGKTGRYSQFEVRRGLPQALLDKYFEKQGTDFVLSEKVRRFVTWKILNLTKPWFIAGPFDLIFIRNVLIYFSVETKKDILEKLGKVLKPGGIVFLGATESTIGVTDSLQPIQVAGGGIVYCLKGHTPGFEHRKAASAQSAFSG